MLRRILCAVMALCLLLSALPAAAEDAPDMAALYPAAPITLADYTTLYTQMMTDYVDPAYAEKTGWHLVRLPDGAVVVTDGVEKNGVYNVCLTVEGSYVTSIRVAWPYDGTNAQEAFDMYSSFCIMAAMPLALREGMPFEDAMAIVWDNLMAVMNSTSALDVTPVCGMQAQMGRTTGEYGAVTMTYTFHQPAAHLPAPSGKDLTGISAQGYMSALDAYGLSLTDAPLRWTQPEEWLGCTLIAVDSLGDAPALLIREDRIALLSTLTPPLPDDPTEAFHMAKAMTFLTLVPILMADGMTQEEAIAAIEAWWIEAHFTSRLASTLAGTHNGTTFYGYTLHTRLREDGSFLLQLQTPLTEQIDFSQAD